MKLHNFTTIIWSYNIPKEHTSDQLDNLERDYIHRHINPNNAIIMAMTGAKRLREMLKKEDHIVVAPGVYDGLSARIALAAGAEVLYMVRLQSFKPFHSMQCPTMPLSMLSMHHQLPPQSHSHFLTP